MRAGGAGLGLAEAVEDVRQELGVDPLAGVGDDDPHARRRRARGGGTAPPGGGGPGAAVPGRAGRAGRTRAVFAAGAAGADPHGAAGGLNLMALFTRFHTTCWTRSGSIRISGRPGSISTDNLIR